MAIFNPAVDPTRPRDYRESRDITPGQPIYAKGQAPNTINPTGITHADTSQGLAYQGAAHAIEGAGRLGALTAGMADTVVKNELSEQLFTKLNNEREAYTAALRVANAAVGARGGGGTTTLDEYAQASGDEAGGSNPPDDVMSARAEATPAEVTAVPRKLEQLVAARGAGKISPTEYLGRQNAILKDVRYNWSGWREYIDREASSILGGNVANMYVRSMMHDFNAAAAGKAQKDPNYTRDMNYATANLGLLHGTTIYQDVRNQVPGAAEKLYAYTAPYKAAEEALSQAKIRRENAVGTEEAKVKLADAEVDQAMNTTTMKNFNTVFPDGKAPDIGESGPSGQQIQNFALKFLATKQPMPPEEARTLLQINAALKAKNRLDLLEYGNKKGPNDRTLIQDSGGQAKYNAKIDEHQKIYDVVEDAINNQNYGLIHGAAHAVSDANDSTMKALYDNEVGVWLKTNAALIKLGGPSNAFSKLLNMEFLESGAAGGGISGFVDHQKKKMITQPELETKGSFVTLNGVIEDAIAKKKLIPDMPGTIQGFVGLVDKIPHNRDPERNYPDKAKIGLIQGVFGPGNRTLLDKFNREGDVDPATGVTTKDGKYSVYERLTKPDIGAEVDRLDKLNPQLGLMRMYKNTLETFFGRDLLSKEIQTLNVDPHVFRNAQLTYDSDKHRIKVEFDPKAETDVSYSIPRAQHTIGLINRGLASMANVAKATGEDVNKYLFNWLVEAGYDLNGPIKGFPEYLLQGVKSAREDALKEQERLRKPYRVK